MQDDDDFVRINIHIPVPEEINRVPLPGNISDMTYDDTADEILALSIEERALIRYPHDLVREPTQSDIPSEVPLAGYGSR